jgi:hypothetical protein
MQCSVEIPVDPLLREMKRGRPYVLGLGRAAELVDGANESWTHRVAQTLQARSGRSTLLIETELSESDHSASESESVHSGVTHAYWPVVNDASRHAFRELAAFPKWKQQYPLIVLHLGGIESSPFSSLGKLCDGIAIAAEVKHSRARSFRLLSRSLRMHQRNGLRIVGMWSIEIG